MLFRYYFLIKLYINTWKSSIQTGLNRCKWVRMDADGCIRAQGTWESQKQGTQAEFMVTQARICVLWPGKFPRTSCFCNFGKKWCEWVQIGAYWFGWLRIDAWTQGGAKTRQKESQMGEQGMFSDECTQCKKTGSGQGWPCWSEGIIFENGGWARGLRYVIDMHK